MNQKPDAHVFVNTIEQLKKQSWLGPSRRWWPDYLFHFTDVHNAARILDNNHLYSRNYLAQNGGMINENASPIVIDQTDGRWKDYVRFYFRPKTPTQYNNEGFRPESERTFGGAHCPIPVFFLFDSLPLLCMRDSLFSYGSLAVQNAQVYNTGLEFSQMPFDSIYHEGPYDVHWESHIKFNRHAEVIIPDKCSLEHLRFIICRSAAERETLLSLLSWNAYDMWADKIILDTRTNVYFSYWTYINQANLTLDQVIFTVNKGTKVRGSFKAHLEVLENETGITHTWTDENYRLGDTLTIGLGSLTQPQRYDVKLFLDNQLAYMGSYVDEDWLPF